MNNLFSRCCIIIALVFCLVAGDLYGQDTQIESLKVIIFLDHVSVPEVNFEQKPFMDYAVALGKKADEFMQSLKEQQSLILQITFSRDNDPEFDFYSYPELDQAGENYRQYGLGKYGASNQPDFRKPGQKVSLGKYYAFKRGGFYAWSIA